jgi:hypothetical protein
MIGMNKLMSRIEKLSNLRDPTQLEKRKNNNRDPNLWEESNKAPPDLV